MSDSSLYPNPTPGEALNVPDAVVELRGPARRKARMEVLKPLPPDIASPKYVYAVQGATKKALDRWRLEPSPVRLWWVARTLRGIHATAPLLMLKPPPENPAFRLSQLLAAVDESIEPRLLAPSPTRTIAWGEWRAGKREPVLAELRAFAEHHGGKADLEDVLAGGPASEAALVMVMAGVARMLLGLLERP
jgi:hypothetical protein